MAQRKCDVEPEWSWLWGIPMIDPDGDATGGDGGIGGNGGFGGPGAGDPNDPNNVGYGDAGAGGAGGAGGAAGADGLIGGGMVSITPSYGGANYYESGCKI